LAGHQVHQILADFQDRGQAGLDAGVARVRGEPVGIGDGWLRLMRFEIGGEVPTLAVRTYSPDYGGTSRQIEGYADWYKAHEEPGMSDGEYLEEDDLVHELVGFRSRFGPPR
jgi:hypothetical protein